MSKLLKIGITILSVFLFSFILTAQQTAQLKVTTAADPKEGEPIVVLVTPNPANLSLNKVTFYYRAPGGNFIPNEMTFDKGAYTFSIPANKVVPPSIEYYVIASKNDGTNLIFPGITSEQPEVDVQNSPAFFSVRPVTADETVTILMGEPGATASVDDFIIMMSYYRISEQIDIKSIKLTINGLDVTSKSTITSDALTYLPETPPAPGMLDISFNAKLKDGSAVGPITWKTTAASAEVAEEIAAEEKNFNISGNVWDEARYENIAGSSNTYHRANFSASGNYKWLNFSTNLLGTSEEKSFLQPSNRYSLKFMTEYLDLGFGDVYPSFSRLVMNGTRVRGLEVNLKLKAINIDFTTGQMVRGVEANLNESDFYVDQHSSIQADTLAEKGYILYKGKYVRRINNGTYERSLTSGKLSFGNKLEGFNWGLTFLKAIDDTSSNLNGGQASANLAFGSDMQVVLDNNRFNWYADAAMSAGNNDIRNGLDSTSKKTLEDNLPSFIKLNTIESILPLSTGLVAPLGTSQILDFMALQTGLKLNYWNNFLKAEFVRYGASYKSDGLSYLQNDLQGLKFTDRLRLFQNKLIVSGGYDRLTDNLAKAKDARVANPLVPGDTITVDGTTLKQVIRSGIAVFPGGKWPSLSIDFIQNKNTNDLFDTQPAAADNVSKTFQISSSYGFSVGEAYHNVSVSFATTNKIDNRNQTTILNYGIANVDQKNRSIFLSYSTTIGNDLSVGGSFTNSLSDYNTIAVQDTATKPNPKVNPSPTDPKRVPLEKGDVGYAKLVGKETTFNIIEVNAVKMMFNNKLKVGGRANMTLSDNNQYLFGGNAEYMLIKNLFATYDLNYFINSGGTNDFITAIRLQWVF